MFEKILLPLNLQFFANDLEDEEPDNKPDENKLDESNNKPNDEPDEKIFTQKQVNRMMAAEKRQGKQSILSQLGFKDEDEAKKAINLLNALMDSQKGEDEKNNEKLSKKDKEKEDAEKRAFEAECKLSLIMAGVNKESIDDVLAIALPKINEKDDLDDVLNEMKGQKRYSMFFDDSPLDDSENNDTGSKPKNNNMGNNIPKNYGENLAKSNQAQKTKSSFFNEEV